MDNDFPESFPKLYTDLAHWFHLLTAPEDYAEEARFFRKAIAAATEQPPQTMLELGSGGGNNASHLKSYFNLTLVDISPQMLDISRQINPECDHVLGDMRSVRLDQLFDAVFVHDAISYITTPEELSKVIETADLHCRPGGVILLAPDHVKENFEPSTSHGGHDGRGQGIRYLEWSWDPDPDDTTYITTMVYAMKTDRDEINVEYDQHVLGIFPRQTWINLLEKQGLQPEVIIFDHSELEPGTYEIFLARKRKENIKK